MSAPPSASLVPPLSAASDLLPFTSLASTQAGSAPAQHCQTGSHERVLPLSCQGTPLLAILSEPIARIGQAAGAAGTAVLIVVGGPQYRAGSHRQFVLTARHLANAGYPCLRFDYRGMGDSAGPLGHFERVSEDIGTAIDGLVAATAVQRVVLWGLCDGASAALLYLQQKRDPRVAGLVLLNPWVRSVATQAAARVKHYYAARLKDRAFWKKLFSGGVALGAVGEVLSSLWQLAKGRRPIGKEVALQPRSFQERMAAAFRECGKPVFLVMSEKDQTAREFDQALASQAEWAGAATIARLTRYDAQGADHTFSESSCRLALDERTVSWLRTQGL